MSTLEYNDWLPFLLVVLYSSENQIAFQVTLPRYMNSPNTGGILIRKDEACKGVQIRRQVLLRGVLRTLVEAIIGRMKLERVHKANRLELSQRSTKQSAAAPKSLFYHPLSEE